MTTSIINESNASVTAAFAAAAPKDETVETLAPWSKRWSESKIGWHKTDPHHFLQKYEHLLFVPPNNDNDACSDSNDVNNGVRILVPLCGKSVDMAYLANLSQVSTVIGVDGVKVALEEFITENPSLEIQKETIVGSMETYAGKKVKLLRGDFFDLSDHETDGRLDVILDRASIVAIRPELRKRYVDTIGKVIKPGGSILLITVDRREGTEQARMAGPPFSVNESDVRSLYESAPWVDSVTKLEELDEFVNDPGSIKRWESIGLTSIFEICFLIKAKL